MPLKALWARGCKGRPLPLRLWKIWEGGFWLRSLRECIWREVILRALSMRIQVTVSEHGGVLRDP